MSIKHFHFQNFKINNFIFIFLIYVFVELFFYLQSVSCLLIDNQSNIDNSFIEILLLFLIIRVLFFYLCIVYKNYCGIANQASTIQPAPSNYLLLPSSKDASTALLLSDILYFKQIQNYVYIHKIGGDVICKYTSLVKISDALPYNSYYRVSRNCIVMKSKIVNCFENHVYLSSGSPTEIVKLAMYKCKEKQQQLLEAIESDTDKNSERWNKSLIKKERRKIEIYNVIITNPGINAMAIKGTFPQVTLRTLYEDLKELKEMNAIVYEGSNKTGGYYQKIFF